MTPADKMRRLEVWVTPAPPGVKGVGQWVELEDMGRLEGGDRFRMFDPDGRPVQDNDGNEEWIAAATPQIIVRYETTCPHDDMIA